MTKKSYFMKVKKRMWDSWQLPLPPLTWTVWNTKSALICNRFITLTRNISEKWNVETLEDGQNESKWIVGVSQCGTINEGWTLRWCIRWRFQVSYIYCYQPYALPLVDRISREVFYWGSLRVSVHCCCLLSLQARCNLCHLQKNKNKT